MTITELADVVGVSPGRIRQYRADGMPPCGKRGRNLIFDPVDAHKWISERVTTRGDTTHGLAALGELAGVSSENAAGHPSRTSADETPDILPDPVPTPGTDIAFDDVLNRARTSEAVVHEKYLQAVNDDDAATAVRLHRVWLNNVDGLRRLEVDAAKIRKNKEESVSREYHERILIESHSLVAAAMLQGAKSIAPDLIDEIKKHKTHGAQVRAAYKLLDLEMRKMRRSLARELEKVG